MALCVHGMVDPWPVRSKSGQMGNGAVDPQRTFIVHRALTPIINASFFGSADY
jgi:hypothetical protein